MNITEHAIQRCKQRGIPAYLLDVILENGTTESKPGNATLFKIGKKDIDWMIHDLKGIIQLLDRLKRARVGAVITDDDGAILTTYKIYG